MASVDVKQQSAQGLNKGNGQTATSAGLQIPATFCPVEVSDPFDTVQWEKRSAQIKDEIEPSN